VAAGQHVQPRSPLSPSRISSWPARCRRRRSTSSPCSPTTSRPEQRRRRLPQPGRGLWRGIYRARCLAGGDPGAGLRRPLLGLIRSSMCERTALPPSARCMAPARLLHAGRPNWQGQVPKASSQVFRSSSTVPRRATHFSWMNADDRPSDPASPACSHDVSAVGYDGTMKSKDWRRYRNGATPGRQATKHNGLS